MALKRPESFTVIDRKARPTGRVSQRSEAFRNLTKPDIFTGRDGTAHGCASPQNTRKLSDDQTPRMPCDTSYSRLRSLRNVACAAENRRQLTDTE